jgi:hypothetical protein
MSPVSLPPWAASSEWRNHLARVRQVGRAVLLLRRDAFALFNAQRVAGPVSLRAAGPAVMSIPFQGAEQFQYFSRQTLMTAAPSRKALGGHATRPYERCRKTVNWIELTALGAVSCRDDYNCHSVLKAARRTDVRSSPKRRPHRDWHPSKQEHRYALPGVFGQPIGREE